MQIDIKNLSLLSEKVRRHTIEMSYRSQTGETGSALCISDVLVALYFAILRVFPNAPKSLERDRFILSKGHGGAALYATLAVRGFFSEELLKKYKTDGGIFHGHPCKDAIAGIEASTGSLGHGLSIGAGMALALHKKPHGSQVWVLLGDGECNEGMVWEAAQFIGTRKLSNVKVVIDRNWWQAFGHLTETNSLNMEEQWKAFGFQVDTCDGHDFQSLIPTLKKARQSAAPHVVIANTISGKGIPEIENTLEAHYFVAKANHLVL